MLNGFADVFGLNPLAAGKIGDSTAHFKNPVVDNSKKSFTKVPKTVCPPPLAGWRTNSKNLLVILIDYGFEGLISNW